MFPHQILSIKGDVILMRINSISIKLIVFTVVTICIMTLTTLTLYKRATMAVEEQIDQLVQSFFLQIQNQIELYMSETVDMVKIFSYNSSVQKFLSAEDTSQRYEQFKYMDNLYLTTRAIKTNLKDALIITGDDKLVSMAGQVYNQQDILHQLNTKKPLTLSSIKSISPYHSATISNDNTFMVYSPIYGRDNEKNKVEIGKVAFIMDLVPLFDMISDFKVTDSSELLVLDKNNGYIVGTSHEFYEYASEKGLQDSFSRGINFNSKPHDIFVKELNDSDFRLICAVPQEEIYSYGGVMQHITSVLIFIQIVATAILGFWIVRSISSPIKKLEFTMKQVQGGNFSQRANLKAKNEIGNLANKFDNMLDEIETLTRTIVQNQSRLYELQIKNNQIELISLQNQINPHFLHNTLGCIRSIALYNNQTEISLMTKALAKIYNYILRSKDIVTVYNELEILKYFNEIYQIRMGERLKILFNVDSALFDKPILKLILQPLLENAVEHGIFPNLNGGTVCINGYLIDNRMIFEVIDDGCGMCDDKVQQLNNIAKADYYQQTRENYGLYNTISRLRLLYGGDFDFTCESELEKGSKIVLSIPTAVSLEGVINDSNNDC